MKAILKELGITVLIALVIYFGVQVTLQQYRVEQTSMLPNLEEGQRVFVNKIAFNFKSPERGDIVVFKPVEGIGTIPLVKRIIGLPGDTIEVKSGLVYIDGIPLDESYVIDPPRYSMEPFVVPPQQYFVLGDNRNNSRDSHFGWTVPRDKIVGKAWVSIWPPEKWGLVPDYSYASE